MYDPFASLTPAERQQWLTRTDREISDARRRLSKAGSSDSGAQMTVDILLERKAKLLNHRAAQPRCSAGAPKITAQPVERKTFAQFEAERKAKELADFKARQETDERLRNFWSLPTR